MGLNDRLFVTFHPGTTTHVYDREKPAPKFRGEWYKSLCGASASPVKNAKSFNANRQDVTCDRCRQILSSLGG